MSQDRCTDEGTSGQRLATEQNTEVGIVGARLVSEAEKRFLKAIFTGGRKRKEEGTGRWYNINEGWKACCFIKKDVLKN